MLPTSSFLVSQFGVDKKTRVWLYPELQFARAGAFLVVVPIEPQEWLHWGTCIVAMDTVSCVSAYFRPMARHSGGARASDSVSVDVVLDRLCFRHVSCMHMDLAHAQKSPRLRLPPAYERAGARQLGAGRVGGCRSFIVWYFRYHRTTAGEWGQ
jgi:hypothetical protein